MLVVVLSCEDAPLTLRNIVDIDVEVALLSANDRAALLTRIFRHMRCTAARATLCSPSKHPAAIVGVTGFLGLVCLAV